MPPVLRRWQIESWGEGRGRQDNNSLNSEQSRFTVFFLYTYCVCVCEWTKVEQKWNGQFWWADVLHYCNCYIARRVYFHFGSFFFLTLILLIFSELIYFWSPFLWERHTHPLAHYYLLFIICSLCVCVYARSTCLDWLTISITVYIIATTSLMNVRVCPASLCDSFFPCRTMCVCVCTLYATLLCVSCQPKHISIVERVCVLLSVSPNGAPMAIRANFLLALSRQEMTAH